MNQLNLEQTILGLILRAPDDLGYVQGMLSPDDFMVPACRNLFGAMAIHGADITNLATAGVQGWDASAMAELLMTANYPGAMESAVRIVKERSILRSVAGMSKMLGDIATRERASIDDVKMALDRLNEIADGGSVSAGGLKHVSVSTQEVLDSLKGGERRFFPTGVGQIDRVISGFFRGDFILLGGRPSMGKTALAMHILRTMATSGYPVGIFSMEMSRSALAERDLAYFSGVDSSRIRSGRVGEREIEVVEQAAQTLNKLPIYVDDQPALSIRDLHYRAKQFVRKHNGRVIAVDYLQLASGDGNNDNSRVSAISRGLKAMARDLNVPVLVLSQLNRSLESRQDRRPILSDLRDSGSLEQDADVIMFIYRDGAYATPKETVGSVEVIISKQRCGPLGTAELWFEGATQSFS